MPGERMYRVVLIDDEGIILEGLRRVIKWSDHRCEVAGTASDGREGSEVIRRVKPHILITDIRMPGDDGLTMIAGLRSEFPNMQITVLTGYREFGYAQQAIHLGVTRFLLKPSKMDEINEALQTMVERLDKLPPEISDPEDEPEDNSQAADMERAGSFIVNQAVAYMERNYKSRLSLQEVADSCFVSQWHLSKLLNKYAQKNFYDILNTIRIREAKELLRDPELRVSDVCDRVGYTDAAHFARTFRKITGMSANEYRNSLKYRNDKPDGR